MSSPKFGGNRFLVFYFSGKGGYKQQLNNECVVGCCYSPSCCLFDIAVLVCVET